MAQVYVGGFHVELFSIASELAPRCLSMCPWTGPPSIFAVAAVPTMVRLWRGPGCEGVPQ